MIEINCDMGEGLDNEQLFMPYISACNIACGGHAGNNDSMYKVLSLAKKYSVKIGAHPSYPDRENFGRVSMAISSTDLVKSIQTQIQVLEKACQELNTEINHIKPHGALYNDIAKNQVLANAFLDSIEAYKNRYKLYIPYQSIIETEAKRRSFGLVYEVFADRNYNDNLTLVSRKENNSMLTKINKIIPHIQSIHILKEVKTISGKYFPIKADTFCVHSDTENALEIVKQIHQHFNS
jgi:lactam utilization protein B